MSSAPQHGIQKKKIVEENGIPKRPLFSIPA